MASNICCPWSDSKFWSGIQNIKVVQGRKYVIVLYPSLIYAFYIFSIIISKFLFLCNLLNTIKQGLSSEKEKVSVLFILYFQIMKPDKTKPKAKQNQKLLNYESVGRGQYELHILIQSTSGLSLQSDSTVDAKVAVTALGKTQYTQVKSGIGVEQVYWGQHLYFQKQIESSQQIENQRVLIAVYDYNKLLVNSLIGSYEIDLQRIYSEPNHTIEHTWLSLSNVEKNFAEITGYIKISISLLNQKDQNIQLEVEPVSSITKQKKVLVPPQIQRKTYQIVVDVMEGKNIKPADGKTVDSYVGIEFGQIFSVSETITKNCDPVYKTRVFLPMSLPAVIQNIAFRLNDFNYITSVEVLGSYYLNINQLIKSYENPPKKDDQNMMVKNNVFNDKIPYEEFRWVNFYGPQLNTSRADQKNLQQFFPKLATYYVGSVLMRVKIKQNSTPQNKKQQISAQDIKDFRFDKVGPPLVFRLFATITAALNLIDKNRKYKICVRVGHTQAVTEFSGAKNGFCFWDVQVNFKIILSPIQNMPDIFVYLVNDKEQKICYLRYAPKLGVILQDQWVKLNPDPAILNIQKQQAGYIKLGLTLNQEVSAVAESPKFRKLNNGIASAYQANRKSGRIVIDFICGQSLIPLDDDGGVDAFFTFTYMQSEVTSKVKNASLNPVYYQKLVIQADILEDREACPPIIVNAYDKDTMSNEFLGTTFIDIDEAVKNKCLAFGFTSNVQPYWFTLTQNGLPSGRFLASIRLLPNYTNTNIPKQIMLPKKDYQVNLVIMGLRSLKNSGIIPVKQPFIQFDFAALDMGKMATKQIQQSKLIKTEPKQKGRNVNITTVVPAKISLPSNYKYWPSLSAVVKDNVLGNLYQPIIGYFSINLQNSYQRSKDLKQAFKNKRQSLNDSKTKIVKKPPRLEGISDNVLMTMRNFIMKCLNYNWEILDDSVAKKLNKLKNSPKTKINEDYVVVFPNYQKETTGKIKKEDGTEQQKFKYVEKYKNLITENGEYMQIGFDDVKMRMMGTSKRNKHYRFVLQKPYEAYYEQVYGRKMGAMDQIDIRTGRVFTSKDAGSAVLKELTQQDTIAGKFKGQLFISQHSENSKKQDEQFKQTSTALLNLLMRKGKICMYLYVIEAANLPSKDALSNSDPYLVVRGGKNKVSFEKEYFEDDPNPQFYKKINMVLDFPQDSAIDIEVWDYDPIGGDQLIGKATIDIENRIHAKLTDARFNNPIQTHNLSHENSRRPQGLVRFWLDLVPLQHKSLYRQFDIKTKSAAPYQLRVIVWSCHDMPNNDIEDVSDLYVTCNFNNQNQNTDVHYRSSTGDGNFNWRMIFPVKLPIKNNMITFKVFDKDVFNGDDFLASSSFSLGEYLQEALETCSSVTLLLGTQDLAKQSEVPGGKMVMVNNVPMYDRFDLQTYSKLQRASSNVQKQGKVRVSIQILTQEDAKKMPAGKGRQNPNQHPFLPNPKGRLALSLNPLTMLGQLCGPKFKAKAALIICGVICLALIIYCSVSFGGSLAGSTLANKISG